MSNRDEVYSSIRAFVLEKFPQARKNGLTDELMLLEARVIDSLGVLEVVGFMEGTFGIKVDDDDLTPENFGTLRRMTSFVEQKRTHFGTAAV
jgi:acyl carrier protein